MVQSPIDAGPTPISLPRFCPKCGSHRTEVVGRCHERQTVRLRCNTCGTHSEVVEDSDAGAAGSFSVSAEMDAILAVGRALTGLNEIERQRVLRWASERFGADAALEPQAACAAADAPIGVDDLQ